MTLRIVPRRTARGLLGLLVIAALVVPSAPALAWGNSGDGYGTHDWIVDQAVKVLDGRAAGWFDAQTARLASDDPDTDPSLAQLAHVYRNTGERGGGIDSIATLYDLAQAAYDEGVAAGTAGDATAAHAAFEDASYHIGLLSHILGDLSQPFHTSYDGIGKDPTHGNYELLVNSAQRRSTDRPDWQSTRRTVTAISDVRKAALATAAYSRGYFAELYSRLRADGVRLTPRISQITGFLMKRASNDLADIIWSISRDVGAQPAVGSLKLSVKWTGVKSNEGFQAARVTALDVKGKPIEGLRVVVHWPTSTGTRTEILFTDGSGYQSRHGNVGTSPKLTRLPVSASVTVRGVVTTASSWWAITPRLGAGSAGFKTVVSSKTVVPGQVVKVTSLARDAKGRGIPNLLVDWTWNFNGKVVRTRAITDANGRASSTQLITTATPRTTLYVTGHTQSASVNRSVRVSFRRSS